MTGVARLSVYPGKGIYSPDPLLTLAKESEDGMRDRVRNPPASHYPYVHASLTRAVAQSFDSDRHRGAAHKEEGKKKKKSEKW